MIGLVNAVGSYAATRVQSARLSDARQDDTGQTRAPVLNAEQAANRVLNSAVEAIQFQGAQAGRKLPSGDESDRYGQSELEGRLPELVGSVLDTTA